MTLDLKREAEEFLGDWHTTILEGRVSPRVVASLADLLAEHRREAAAEEREQCAKLADIEKGACDHHLRATQKMRRKGLQHQAGAQIARDIAAFIRQRGEEVCACGHRIGTHHTDEKRGCAVCPCKAFEVKP